MEAILKCLEQRNEALRLVRRFSTTDLETITERSVRFFLGLHSKVASYNTLRQLDISLATKHDAWLENSGRTEDELEDEAEQELRPSYIDKLLRESDDLQTEVLNLFKEIKLKFPHVEQTMKYLDFVEVEALPVEKHNKMKRKVARVMEKVNKMERKKSSTKEQPVDQAALTKHLTFLSQIESELDGLAEEVFGDIQTYGRFEKDISFLRQKIQRIKEDIVTRLEVGSRKEREMAIARHNHEQKQKALAEFRRKFPAMTRKEPDEKVAWRGYGEEVERTVGDVKTYNQLRIPLKSEKEIKNDDDTLAVRVLSTDPNSHNKKDTKTLLIVGMTGTGKSTLLDGLVNFIHDVRYEDEVRLRLVSLTQEEEKRESNQAASQTDHVTVYKIKWRPGMNIDYNITLIDSPGLGDTRGLQCDKATEHFICLSGITIVNWI